MVSNDAFIQQRKLLFFSGFDDIRPLPSKFGVKKCEKPKRGPQAIFFPRPIPGSFLNQPFTFFLSIFCIFVFVSFDLFNHVFIYFFAYHSTKFLFRLSYSFLFSFLYFSYSFTHRFPLVSFLISLFHSFPTFAFPICLSGKAKVLTLSFSALVGQREKRRRERNE